MLIGIYNNGELVSNPKMAPKGSIETHQVRDRFEIRYLGQVIGTFSVFTDNLDEVTKVAILVSRAMPRTETYGERYQRTTEWAARHIAKDLMETNGKNARVSTSDESKIAAAEKAAV